MSASQSLPRSSQARASEQRRSSQRARRTESTGLAFNDTASFSPRKPWFSCLKARGSKDLYATSSTTPPAPGGSAYGHRSWTGLRHLRGKSSTGRPVRQTDLGHRSPRKLLRVVVGAAARAEALGR